MPPAARSRARRSRRSGIRSATREPTVVGLNCALGAKQLRPYVEEFSRIADVRGLRLSERRPAQRLRRVRRAGLRDRGAGARVCRAGPGEYRRRLLRHHRRAHRPHPRGGGAACRRACRRELRAALPPVGTGAARHRARQPVRQRRRAHQRHRLGQVPPPDRGRRLRRRARCRARAGRQRRADHRHQHGRGHARFGSRDGALPEPDRLRAGHRARAGHDRLLQVVGDRGRAEVPAGQGHRQFDQPEGGRGAVPRAGAPGARLRRRRGRHGVRRAGPGRHASSARCRSASAPTSC